MCCQRWSSCKNSIETFCSFELDRVWWSAKAAYSTAAESEPFAEAVSHNEAFRSPADCLQQVIPACVVKINSLAKRGSVSMPQLWTGNQHLLSCLGEHETSLHTTRNTRADWHGGQVYKYARLPDCLPTLRSGVLTCTAN